MSGSAAGESPKPVNIEEAYTKPAIVLLRKNAPEIYERFIESKKEQWRHERRLSWADLVVQVIGHFSGLVALGVLATIAWHAIDRGDATQGASIICTGAVSIVTVFVTGRLTDRRHQEKTDPSD